MTQKDNIRNNKISFYEALEKLNPNMLNMVMTVTDTKCLGEKAILSGGKLVWQSCDGGIFDACAEEAASIAEGGTKMIGGCRVFCEVIGNSKKLVICGGGHVSIPIISMGRMLGFAVTVLEDRPKFADHARKAGADRVICDAFDKGLEEVGGDEDTYFVIVTRGHRCDQICLEHIIQKRHAYIGMMGSRRRVTKVKEAIIENGGDAEIVNRVHTPIGLDIGAETPEEIAVAVVGEIIQVKNAARRSSGYPDALLTYIHGELLTGIEGELPDGQKPDGEDKKSGVLATIVARKGSAPRRAGTKMLLLSDGNTVGTIGGGCVEAEVQRAAMRMLSGGKREPELLHVDMSGAYAEEEGMVCGGEIDVLLEVIR